MKLDIRIISFCLLQVWLYSSCTNWQEAKNVISTADSINQTEHVIYDDTMALSKVIHCLDNPFGRMLMSSTLGKAYYYMGRNFSMSNRIAEAADYYIEADRLQIADPLYRGRVNSCLGYICAQNNNDSLALIFYDRACNDFQESGDEWYYAQMLLDCSERHINLHKYCVADSLLSVAKSYHIDSAYYARYLETIGLYFYKQQQYDSALVYFQRGLNYWQSEQDRCFSYMKIMQVYLDIKKIIYATPYAQSIIKQSNNPNYLVNAYYCLMQDAKEKNDTKLLSYYSHARTDAQRLLLNYATNSAEAMPQLERYLINPHPFRWAWLTITCFIILCILLITTISIYRKITTIQLNVSNEQIISLSAHIKKQKNELDKHSEKHYHDKRLHKIRRKAPKPLPQWNEYDQLKKDLNPYLHNWLIELEKLRLTNRENVFCVLSFIYSHMPTDELANHLCITKESVLVCKTRIAKKIGITSAQLSVFLQNLTNLE